MTKSNVAENEDHRKKEQGFKRYKDSVSSGLWKAEREVKKLLQISIKKIVESVD